MFTRFSRPQARLSHRLTPVILSLAALATVTLTVTGSFAQSPEVRWNNVIRTDREVTDGMLAPGRLVLHFAPTRTPRTIDKADGSVTTDQPALNSVLADAGTTGFERLFAELPPAKRASQPPARARLYVVEFADRDRPLKEIARAFLALPEIVAVEPDAIHFAQAELPNDSGLNSQWWLRNTELDGGDIRAVPAWYHAKGDPNVIVAVADTGVDWMHPDLGGTQANGFHDGVMWTNQLELNGTAGVDDDGNGKLDDVRGWDFVHWTMQTIPNAIPVQNPPQEVTDPDPDPRDYDGHGTLVSGCISSLTDNGVGIASTSWGCTIMPLKIGYRAEIYDNEGNLVQVTGVGFTIWMAQALDYARVNGAKVFNLSYGNSSSGGLPTATTMAVNAGMLIVESAGNDNTDPTSNANVPATYLSTRADVLSVAATDRNDQRSGFSNYGSWVDLAAPGSAIYTTAFDVTAAGAAQHTYGTTQGTSFSAPIVAGAGALALSANPGWTGQQVLAALIAATDDIDALNPGFEGKLGSGRLNMAKLFPLPAQWTVPEVLPELIDAFNLTAPGGEIRVLGGHMIGTTLELPARDVAILGGFDATYTTRDVVSNLSVISPLSSGPGLLAVDGNIDNRLILDGFEVRDGTGQTFSFPVAGRFGGGMVVRNGAAPLLRNCAIRNCTVQDAGQTSGGGGIVVFDSDPTLEDCIIENNSAVSGAGIYVSGGNPTFRRVTVRNNVSTVGNTPLGGGIHLTDAGNVLVEECVVTGHDVAGPGGGIYATNTQLTVSDTQISNNFAADDGGGIHVTGGSYTGLRNTVSGNELDAATLANGGGAYFDGTTLAIDQSHYEANHSDFTGGGLDFRNTSGATIENSLFVLNTAGFFGSGLNATSAAGTQLNGCTVADNFSGSQGGSGAVFGAGDADLSNNIFAFNGDGTGTMADGVQCNGAVLTFACNLTSTNAGGNYGGCPDPTGTAGNFDADPLFCRSEGNWNVATTSPALAANNPNGPACDHIGASTGTCAVVAVFVSNFAAVRDGRAVEIRWSVAPRGWRQMEILRGPNEHEAQPIGAAILDDRPNGTLHDPDAPVRATNYWLRFAEDDGSSSVHGPAIAAAATSGLRLAMRPGEPNPFRTSTSISFEMPGAGPARLTVHDLRGRHVATLIEGSLTAGSHTVQWNGRDAAGRATAAGSYFVRLENSGAVRTQRLIRLSD